jgi:hypothetical protein
MRGLFLLSIFLSHGLFVAKLFQTPAQTACAYHGLAAKDSILQCDTIKCIGINFIKSTERNEV